MREAGIDGRKGRGMKRDKGELSQGRGKIEMEGEDAG